MTTLFGVGSNSANSPSSINGKELKEYQLWYSMLQRCYEEYALKRRPEYSVCSVSDNFRDYSYFYDWCQNQIGFGADDFHLDKDLLVKGNKIYNENNCCFLPRRINSALSRGHSRERDLPIGVYFNKKIKRFVARCKVNGKSTHVASCKCPIEAFNKYKVFKEDYIKTLANEYKDVIDPKAYNALMNYTVEITD